MAATKLALPVAIENCASAELADGTPVAILQCRRGKQDAALYFSRVLFDSRKTKRNAADKRFKGLHDWFEGPDSWASDAEPDPDAERYLLVVADLNARLEGWQGERCTLVATDGAEVTSMLAKLPPADAALATTATKDEEPKPAPKLSVAAAAIEVEREPR